LAALIGQVCQSGCTLPQSVHKEVAALATESPHQEPQRLRIAYRTQSDRLNVQADGDGAEALEGVSVATLNVRYPHPEGIPEQAQVTLIVQPSIGRHALASGGMDDDMQSVLADEFTTSPEQIIEARTMNIPAWQAQAIVAQLREEGFFNRTRTIAQHAFLAVQSDQGSFAKNYKASPELDGLLLKAHRQGRPIAVGEAYTSAKSDTAMLLLPPVR